jgi:hypothetical protein
MRGIDSHRLQKVVDEMAPLFYALMVVSLLAILAGALGSGALLLILGSAVQVVRASCEGLAVRQRNRASRVRSVAVRATRHPAQRRVTSPRHSARRVAVSAARR